MTQIIGTLLLSKGKVNGVVTLIITNIISYWNHRMIHSNRYSKIFTNNFHTSIHHNSKINRKAINIFKEFYGDIINSSCLLCGFGLLNKRLDIYTCLYIGLLYATQHNINQNFFISSKTHEYHHKYENKNFTPDYLDLIFDTKYDTDLENMNNILPNGVILSFILYKMKKRYPERYFRNLFYVMFICSFFVI
jgi:hypothetical protein